jgi:AmmeMemoRadiSam system protein B
MTETTHPKLRLIDAQTIEYEGATYILMRDPLALTEKNILVPQPLAPALALLDGTRTPPTVRAALAIRYGIFLTQKRVDELILALDDALLLENSRSKSARAIARLAFHQEPYRPPANAGVSYPDSPVELAGLLQGYMDSLNGSIHPAKGVRGIISPHIDYERGGPIYAQTWAQAAEAVRAADLAIIFGTDHYSEGFPISLTLQNYATPFGVLPTDTRIVDQLADIIGVEEAFAGELHHRREHSIELAAVWMHHIRGGQPLQTVPILTGSLGPTGSRLSLGFDLDEFLEVLRQSMAGRSAIVVAAGDLAHVGPAFGTQPVDPGMLTSLKTADGELIAAICSGSAEDFYNAIDRVGDANNICGVSPIYLTLRLLAPLHGQSHGYAVCPADIDNTSVVTICGVTLE